MIDTNEIEALPREVRVGIRLLPPEARPLVRLSGHRVDWSAIDAHGWSPGEGVRVEAAKSLMGDANTFRILDAVCLLDAEGLDALLDAIRSMR